MRVRGPILKDAKLDPFSQSARFIEFVGIVSTSTECSK